jgi:hypothetical protein
MSELLVFAGGMFCGGVLVADCIGYRLAKQGDPFWVGWMQARTFGLFKRP